MVGWRSWPEAPALAMAITRWVRVSTTAPLSASHLPTSPTHIAGAANAREHSCDPDAVTVRLLGDVAPWCSGAGLEVVDDTPFCVDHAPPRDGDWRDARSLDAPNAEAPPARRQAANPTVP